MKISEPILIALITAMPSTLFSAAAFIAAAKGVEKIEQVHIATNSMKDALVKATKDAALLKGHAQGVQDEKLREADSNK